jgi:hypothetical protein
MTSLLASLSSLRYQIQATNETFFKQFEKKEFFSEIRLSYQLAVAVSPLLLLLPKKIYGRKIRRDALLYVRLKRPTVE